MNEEITMNAEVPVPAHTQQAQASTLLSALWRDQNSTKFVGAMRLGEDKPYRQDAVQTIEDAMQQMANWSAQQMDCYFAVSEYQNASSRTASNVKKSYVFWLDIDCGPDKAKDGKGYASVEEARTRLEELCCVLSIPKPTHVVASGGGLHVYWALSDALDPEQWQTGARKLKDLTSALGFLADPSRTCDKASILRVPGTLNHKYQPPRPVTLEMAESSFIPVQDMLRALDAAHTQHCAPPVVSTTGPKAFQVPSMSTLRAALMFLEPDCDESTWTFRRIAPLARLARAHPDMEQQLQSLAKEWSSGELSGKPSLEWSTPGSTSRKTGEEMFPAVWNRFMPDKGTPVKISLGSLFYDARQAGWKQSAHEQPVHVLERSKEEVKAEARQVALTMIEKFKSGDMGAPYEPEALTALGTLGRMHPAELQRIKAHLKELKRNFSLGDLDKAIKSHAKAEKVNAPTHHAYATDILNRLTVNGHEPVAYQGTLYVLDEDTSLWVPLEVDEVERHITTHHDGKENCMRRVDYKSISEQVFASAGNPKFFDNAPAGIVCKGVFYTVDGNAIGHVPLQPEHRQRVMLDFAIEDKPTPRFDKFLHETFQSDVEGEEMEQRQLLQEIAGATLMGLMPRYQKAVFWYDPYGRAGKGTMQNILEKLVPPEFVTAISPVMWYEPYYVVTLAGKRLNVVGELPQDGFIPAAQFKGVIGGDLMTGRNPAGRPISFKNEASHVFMSNHMINTKDYTEAFFERWLMVHFPNSRLKLGLPLDPMLARGIVEEEMGGIAYWALQGAMRLQAQGKFSSSSVHDRMMTQWRNSSNALEEFIHDACELDKKHVVKRKAFYDAFKEWCDDNGRKPQSSKKVYEMLEYNVKLAIRLAKLDGYDVLRGVRLKNGVSQEPAFSIEEAPDSTQAVAGDSLEHPDF